MVSPRAVVVPALMLATVSGARGDGIVNGGFETGQPGTGLPNVTGEWSLDVANFVGPADGITPLAGESMAHFIFTTPAGPSGQTTGSELIQLVDLAGFEDVIAGGNAVFDTETWFNRVGGDAETDTAFLIRLRAYPGDPLQFPQQKSNFLVEANHILITDDEVTTWERLSGSICIPPDTAYIYVAIAAVENIANDAVSPEFDGHYADEVSCRIVPDSCCPWDLNGNGEVDTSDFLTLLGSWGQVDVPADFDGNGVGTSDFLTLLGNWGPCSP